jgi:hypothetical protein
LALRTENDYCFPLFISRNLFSFLGKRTWDTGTFLFQGQLLVLVIWIWLRHVLERFALEKFSKQQVAGEIKREKKSERGKDLE